ncbi:uncharacterized protein LOC127771492 [Oryza glaberrima]|uniref:Uncharacterized protein n=1 Tax=Oryza glaberrima TaxID=4538 RepID=I1PLU3_ORYGL|nr:uncharacterized protein LOC127771492 [Oryza glaberrima]
MASVWATEQPGVELEVKVVRVAGVEARPEGGGGGGGGGLFVRYYVPAGDGKRRIRVDTREVPCGGGDGEEDGAFWGELARFERRGGGAPASVGGVVFELRWRPRRRSPAFLGMLGNGRPSSRVLARGELACQDDAAAAVTPAPASSGSTWLRLSPACRELSGCKAPKLLVEVRMIHAADNYGAVKATRSLGGVNHHYCCSDGERCAQCGWIGTEEDMFLAATFTHE